MDKEGRKSAHTILNLNWQQGVAFCHDAHSLPSIHIGQGASIRKQWKKSTTYSLLLLYKVRNKREISKTNALQLGLKMHSQVLQLQLLHYAGLIPQVPWFEKQKPNALTLSARNLFCLMLLL